jgi:hypothetical protein
VFSSLLAPSVGTDGGDVNTTPFLLAASADDDDGLSVTLAVDVVGSQEALPCGEAGFAVVLLLLHICCPC